MMEAERLPLAVSDNVRDIAEEATDAAFGKIAERLESLGFPVTGDFAPDEVLELEHAFQGYVLRMALNNEKIASMQEEVGKPVVLTEDEIRVLATIRDFHSFAPGENAEDDEIVEAVDGVLKRALP